MSIQIQITINLPVQYVWEYYTQPNHIVNWNFATDEWCCPNATNNLCPNKQFSWRMEAKDGSMGFDFSGTYNAIINQKEINYTLDDSRKVAVKFVSNKNETTVSIQFEPENENPIDLQQAGWQAILGNFKKYAESNIKKGE